MQISKKKLRKITKDGPFQGKNKVFLGPDGKPISSLEYHLGSGVAPTAPKEESEDEQPLELQAESDAELDPEDEGRHLSRVKSALEANVRADTKLARKKLTERRLKKKRKQRELLRGKEESDPEAGVALGGDSEDQPSEEEEVVIEPKKKKRVKKDKPLRSQGDEEQLALALLGNDDF